MAFTDYLMAAPWYHWVFFVIIASLLSRWRPFKIETEKHTHDHKHIHNDKGDK